MALFRLLLLRTTSSAKFSGSKTNLYGLLRLPKYICPRQLHDSSGLPYVKDRLLSCATKSLDRIAQNPLVGESISSHRLNPAWDRFPMPLSVVRPVSSYIIKVKSVFTHLLTVLIQHACHHNSFWGSRCVSSHAPTISLKPVLFTAISAHIFRH